MSAFESDGEVIEQVAQSDWTDQDLLTKDEARGRLFVEIARTRARLVELEAGTGDSTQISAEIRLLTRRLNAMESVSDEYDEYLDRT